MGELLQIGIDSTDSPRGGCTTYVAALLIERLIELGVKFTDYPNIIRLNPNIPWKTRGNGAVCLRVEVDGDKLNEAKAIATEVIRENSDLDYFGTDPGIVFHRGEVAPEVADFARRTIQEVVTLEEALAIIEDNDAEFVKFKEGRGLIGALAAIGEGLLDDYTFELIAYRFPERRGASRQVDGKSIGEMSRDTSPITFNNLDFETGRILITPHGPDPVLFGIRGETAEVVREAYKRVRTFEEVERWTIFRTNHGTDGHLRPVHRADLIRPYRSIIARGMVVDFPRIIEGGHVILKIRGNVGLIDCVAYEPTGYLNRIVRQLVPGDVVGVHGSVKPATYLHEKIVNLEKIRIFTLKPIIKLENPLCPRCKKRMKSMGTGKGFRCKKCGFRSIEAKKEPMKVARRIREGIYISSPRAHRHLMKPYSRYGREKSAMPTPKHLNYSDFYWSYKWPTMGTS